MDDWSVPDPIPDALATGDVSAWNSEREANTGASPRLRFLHLPTPGGLADADQPFDFWLSGANLARCDLEGAVFGAGSLRDCKFEGANLKGALFKDCDLRSACLRGADLRGASFVRCDVSDVDFSDAIMGETIFAGTKLEGSLGLRSVEHAYPSHIDANCLLAISTAHDSTALASDRESLLKFLIDAGVARAVLTRLSERAAHGDNSTQN